MDSERFDRLSRVLAAHGPRRSVLGLLAAAPVVGGLLGILTPEETEAGGRRKRRKTRNKRQSGDGKKNRTGKRKHKRKQPTCTPTTCAAEGKNCGSIADGCGNEIRCGADSCGDGFSCTDHVCRCPDGTAVCEGACCQMGEVCRNGNGACCMAQGKDEACAGRACGPATDSCTGEVYACGPAGDDCANRDFTCTGDGKCQCEAPRLTCPTSGSSPTCCQSGEVCKDGNGACCSPTTCTAQGKDCGTIQDGCGGTLTCGANAGACPLAGQPCTSNVCGTCVSNCTGKACGADNLCGGTCTACSPTCTTGTCPADQTCQNDGTCQQNVLGIECVCESHSTERWCGHAACTDVFVNTVCVELCSQINERPVGEGTCYPFCT